jgi:HD-GYP domain-containing protein (c-di-GMP phosphodiesterase class II)
MNLIEEIRMDAAAPDKADAVCSALMAVVRETDDDLAEHADGVAELTTSLGHRIGMVGRELRELERAAQLHDLGKLAIADSVLAKPGALDANEWRQVCEHTLVGERMLRSVPGFARVGRIVRSSHERWDGAGYPDGLSGERIPLASRMVAICDAFDAMTSDRAYRDRMTPTDAVDEIQQGAGTQFDPGIVGIFCAVVSDEFMLQRGTQVAA